MEIIVQGHIVLIDDEDWERVSAIQWRVRKNWNALYVVPSSSGVSRKIGAWALHRFLLNAPDGVLVDHKNRNGLDNRKENLRLCDNSRNQANRRLPNTNVSGFRGVCLNKTVNKWQAQIKKAQKTFYLGVFDKPDEAARAYDAKALELYGEFATLNFPGSTQKEAG